MAKTGRPTNEERAARAAKVASGEIQPEWDTDRNDSPTDEAAVALLERSGVALGVSGPNGEELDGSTLPDFTDAPVGTPAMSIAPQESASSDVADSSLTAIDRAKIQIAAVGPEVTTALLEVLCMCLEKQDFIVLFRKLRQYNEIRLHEADIWRIMQFVASRTTRDNHNLLRHNAAIAASTLRTEGRGMDFGSFTPIHSPTLASLLCQGIQPRQRNIT